MTIRTAQLWLPQRGNQPENGLMAADLLVKNSPIN